MKYFKSIFLYLTLLFTLTSLYATDRSIYFCEGSGCAVADWVYFCEGSGCAIADWIYFCEGTGCSVATWVNIVEDCGNADIEILGNSDPQADWIYICEGSGCAIADWLYICEGSGCAIAEWLHIARNSTYADITICMDTESLLGEYEEDEKELMLKKYVAASVYKYLFKDED